MGASLVSEAKGQAILPMQYKMKKITSISELFIKPAVLALTEDMMIANAIAHRSQKSRHANVEKIATYKQYHQKNVKGRAEPRLS